MAEKKQNLRFILNEFSRIYAEWTTFKLFFSVNINLMSCTKFAVNQIFCDEAWVQNVVSFNVLMS